MASSESANTVFPRMQPPTVLSDETKRFLSTTKFYRDGKPLNIHQVLSNHPRAAQSLNRFLDWGDDNTLTSRERRILILRTSVLTRCQYEWGVHSQLGQTVGDLNANEVKHLEHSEVSFQDFSTKEFALITLTDAICRTDTLSDDQWSVVSEILPPPQIIEALVVVGNYRLCSGLINALGVPDEGFMGSRKPDDRNEEARSDY
jgi:alkylhydroperoxidase family enzyme